MERFARHVGVIGAMTVAFLLVLSSLALAQTYNNPGDPQGPPSPRPSASPATPASPAPGRPTPSPGRPSPRPGASPATPAQPNPQGPNQPRPAADSQEAECEPASPRRGDTVECEGRGFEPGSPVRVVVTDDQGRVVFDDTVAADESGVAGIQYTVPRNARSPIAVEMTGLGEDGEPLVLGMQLELPPAQAGVGAAALGATGGRFTTGLLIAGGVLAIGGAALFATRRKRGEPEA